ncbi:MAG: GYF domain-containing protein [Bdellovibrionales bacterium]|nr:GYF domain-containing protein [Bdellovibrionales bacterium]
MSDQKFNVARNGENIGMFAVSSIIKMLATGELQITDFIFDDSQGDWVPILKFSAVLDQMNSSKPKVKPVPVRTEAKIQTLFSSERPEWFVLRGRERLGPLRKHDVIRMMQEKKIQAHDFISKEGEADWVRVVERAEFGPLGIREQWSEWANESHEGSPFFSRSSPRWQARGHIIAHNGQRLLWKGEVEFISMGGLGVRMKNSVCLPGEKVYIHVTEIEGMQPFNHVCEIVSKEFRKGLKRRAESVGYGLRFLEESKEWQNQVETWAKGAQKSA